MLLRTSSILCRRIPLYYRQHNNVIRQKICYSSSSSSSSSSSIPSLVTNSDQILSLKLENMPSNALTETKCLFKDGVLTIQMKLHLQALVES